MKEGAQASARDGDLQRSEARYRNIFDSAAVALWEINFTAAKIRIEGLFQNGVTDLGAYMAAHPEFIREVMDLTIAVDVNDAGIRMLDAPGKSDLLGPVGKVWPPEAEADFAQTVVSAMARKPTFELQTTLRTLSGRVVEVLYSVSYPPEALSLESIFVAFSDLTVLNKAHVALQRAQTDLANSTRMASLGELAASIAHEINQPLAGITSNGQAGLRWLLRDKPNTLEAIEAFETVVGEAKRVAAVVAGIRALAKKEVIEPIDLCLNQMINETLQLLRREFKRNHIDLRTDLDTVMVPVRADRIQIQQVLINLLMNAMQAMVQNNSPIRELIVESVTRDGNVIISVLDSGPGVEPDIRDRMFNAFVTNKPEGMGIGLSLCASIIRLHGGRIWPDFDHRHGGVFRFSLPAISSFESL